MTNWIQALNGAVVGTCQVLAMLVILVGIIKALMIFVKDALLKGKAGEAIQESRLELGHSFSLGLSFLIGASILRTTLAPTWTDIAQLATIIGIRTVLNYFMMQEIARYGKANPSSEVPSDVTLM